MTEEELLTTLKSNLLGTNKTVESVIEVEKLPVSVDGAKAVLKRNLISKCRNCGRWRDRNTLAGEMSHTLGLCVSTPKGWA